MKNYKELQEETISLIWKYRDAAKIYALLTLAEAIRLSNTTGE